MGCFNDPALKVCGWGGVADTNYLYPARWGWINMYRVYLKIVLLFLGLNFKGGGSEHF